MIDNELIFTKNFHECIQDLNFVPAVSDNPN